MVKALLAIVDHSAGSGFRTKNGRFKNRPLIKNLKAISRLDHYLSTIALDGLTCDVSSLF